MKWIARWPVAAVSLLAASCGSSAQQADAGPPDLGVQEDRPAQEPMPVDTGGGTDTTTVVDGGMCNIVIAEHPLEGYQHIPCTSPAPYISVPPSSGNHYPIWAAYQTYAAPIPWGNLVHNLEHGAMIIVYNCPPPGCIDEATRAQAWINALPADPNCSGSHRIILAPDPTLPVRWAATAWLWTLQADCFDEAAFTQFYTDHYDHGPEIVCSSGPNTLDGLCPM